MDKLVKTSEKRTANGEIVSNSNVNRLQREVKELKNQHDTLRIKILTMHGTEKDLAKEKNDKTNLEKMKAMIKKKEQDIIEI